jgi:hypothetical protein
MEVMELARRNGWPKSWVIERYTVDDVVYSLAYDELRPFVDTNLAQASIRQAFIGGSLSAHIFKPAASAKSIAVIANAEAEAARASALRKANKKKGKMKPK